MSDFEEKLKQALQETTEERIKEYYSNVEEPKFSLSYRIWRRRTLKKLEKGNYKSFSKPPIKLKKIRYTIIAAVLISLLLLGVGTYAISNVIGRFYFNRKPTYSRLEITEEEADKTTIEEYYGLPEEDGWEINYYYADDEFSIIEYKEKDGLVISVCQDTIENANSVHIDTEHSIPQAVSMYEEDDGFYIDHGNGLYSLWYIYNGYDINISGETDKNTLINLAYSLKIINLEKNV